MLSKLLRPSGIEIFSYLFFSLAILLVLAGPMILAVVPVKSNIGNSLSDITDQIRDAALSGADSIAGASALSIAAFMLIISGLLYSAMVAFLSEIHQIKEDVVVSASYQQQGQKKELTHELTVHAMRLGVFIGLLLYTYVYVLAFWPWVYGWFAGLPAHFTYFDLMYILILWVVNAGLMYIFPIALRLITARVRVFQG